MDTRRYLVLFRNQPTQSNPPSPEQMQAMFAAYRTWMEQFKAEILDLGDRLRPDGRVLRAAGVVDGPFVEGKEVIGGYMIVGAADMEGALAVVRACPASQVPGGSMEIRELAGATMERRPEPSV